MADDSAGLIDQERRRWPRLRVLLTGSVAEGQTVRPVRLIDISALGVSLVGDDFREVGSLVQFQRNDVQTDARVAWNSGRRSGLEFASRLRPARWCGVSLRRERWYLSSAAARH